MDTAKWSFVAMEYYALILNRTFLVTVDEQGLKGVVCRGLISSGGGGSLSSLLVAPMVVRGNLNDPHAYVDERKLRRSSRANFSIAFRDVKSVRYDKRKKWGMGEYPHDGKVYVQTGDAAREFIILGDQSGAEICSQLSAAILPAFL